MLGEAFGDVLNAAQVGAGWAFTRLHGDLSGPVLAYVRLRGTEDPDAVTSDVFLDAFRNIRTFDGDETSFRAWVFTIARRRLIDEARRRARRPRVADAPLPDVVGGDVEDEALRSLASAKVIDFVRELTP